MENLALLPSGSVPFCVGQMPSCMFRLVHARIDRSLGKPKRNAGKRFPLMDQRLVKTPNLRGAQLPDFDLKPPLLIIAFIWIRPRSSPRKDSGDGPTITATNGLL